jgi:hypothetical protein
VTYHLIAIAPDGTRHPLGREHFERRGGQDCRVRSFAADVEPHALSRKRANQERNRMLMDFDLRGHRIEVVPVTVTPNHRSA